MFGYINERKNNWKFIIGNFLVILAVQILYKLYELLALERFPTSFEIYQVVVTSLIATIAFYGLNKLEQRRHK